MAADGDGADDLGGEDWGGFGLGGREDAFGGFEGKEVVFIVVYLVGGEDGGAGDRVRLVFLG